MNAVSSKEIITSEFHESGNRILEIFRGKGKKKDDKQKIAHSL